MELVHDIADWIASGWGDRLGLFFPIVAIGLVGLYVLWLVIGYLRVSQVGLGDSGGPREAVALPPASEGVERPRGVPYCAFDVIAAWLRQEASARHLSLPRFVSELLQGHARASADGARESGRESGRDSGRSRDGRGGADDGASYEAARRRWMARKPVPLSAPGEKYPTRAEVHERHS